MNKLLLLIGVAISLMVNNYVCAQQQLENPGFESWEEFGFGPDTLEPVGWNSLKSSDGGDLINGVIPVTLKRSTDAHSGMYSVKLENDTILIFVAPGTMTNGRVHATLPPTDAYVYTIDSLPEFNTPFTDKPDSLVIWAKFFPTDNDVAHVVAVLHSDTAKIADPTQTNWIAVANIDIPDQLDNWTRLSVPFEYLNNNTPEFILFAMYAGDAANALQGSILYLDDFELIYYNTGIPSIRADEFSIKLLNDNLLIEINPEYTGEYARLEILDLSGKVLLSKEFTVERLNNVQVNLPAGVYICKIQIHKIVKSQKIIKN